jgi:hypothetical protein
MLAKYNYKELLEKDSNFQAWYDNTISLGVKKLPPDFFVSSANWKKIKRLLIF